MSRQKAYGRRVVSELLNSGLEIDEILLAASAHGHEIDDIKLHAGKRKIRTASLNRRELDKIVPDGNHQGVIAFYQQPETLTLDELIEGTRAGSNSLVVVLDGVEDPGNLGAILRSCEVFGVDGVIIRQRRSAGLTQSAVRSSAGAALRIPSASVSSIDNAVRTLKSNGFWIFGLDMRSEKTIWDTDFSGKTALVLGGEGSGMSRLIRERCDVLAKIPQVGHVQSLNVSVACGVALAEILRQQSVKSGKSF